MKATDYFKKNILKLGDVIEISNSADKDGKYIIFSDEDCGIFLRSMCPLEVNNNGDYNYIAGYATQGLQSRDYNANLKIIGNILEDYKINNNNKTMKITNLAKKLLDNNTRTLIKAGFLDNDLQLTEIGASAIMGLMFFKDKEELVKLAQEKIEEEKNEE